MPRLIDETGNRYGRLTVLYRASNSGKTVKWHCLCDCGQELDDNASFCFNCGKNTSNNETKEEQSVNN